MNRYPLRVEAHRDETLSRWLWLVKWVLLIPHYLALLALWTGLAVLTLVAYAAVLFTGRYPASIRAYNLGVLRWTWRVGYYGYQALGTDRYPPFTLADAPEHPARLRLDDGPPPPRWLPLVAWLFAIPHLIVLAALSGAATWGADNGNAPIGVVTVGLLIAGFALLFTGRYPDGLHDLLVGIGRWNLRVIAYLMLLTPRYPPFRLDQGPSEPDPQPDAPSAASQPRPVRQRAATGSVIALIAGVLLLAPAAAVGIGGGALLALDAGRDRAGYVSSPSVTLTSPTAAVTAENLTIAGDGSWARDLADVGGIRVSATAADGRPVFVGIAAQSTVDAWLAGTAHDRLLAVDNGTGRYHRAEGAVQAISSPADESFWLASATGPGETTAQWTMVNGEYAIVVANLDGSTGVTADVRGSLQVPDLTSLGGGMLAAGIGLGVLAAALIILGGLGLGRRHSGPPTSSGGPAGPVPQQLSPISVDGRP